MKKTYREGDFFNGFKFENGKYRTSRGYDTLRFSPKMQTYIGVMGEIEKVRTRSVKVRFPDGNSFWYPINQNVVRQKVSQVIQNNMVVTKTKALKVKGKDRDITVAVILDRNSGEIKGGYSVRMSEDKANDELGNKIAIGRANSPRTNLLEMQCGEGMDKKFILYAIADNILGKIERGVIDIKGVR